MKRLSSRLRAHLLMVLLPALGVLLVIVTLSDSRGVAPDRRGDDGPEAAVSESEAQPPAGATVSADIIGGPSKESVTQLEEELLLRNSDGELYARIQTGPLPEPRYTEAEEFLPVEPFRPQAEAQGGSMNLLIADGDGDGKEDIILPLQAGEGAGFRLYSGTGRIKLRRSVVPPEGSFRLLFPADMRDGLLYLVAWAHDPEGARGVVAYNLRLDRIEWFFHTPSDPLALRPTGSGYLLSHSTPAQGVYEFIGVEKAAADGYDGALYICEMGFDGTLLRAVRVRDRSRLLRGVGEFRLDPEDPTTVLLT
ncbi:MAG: hypothetical protein ACOC28_04455, partial [Alkalispirochaetaceae bacterium]